MTGRLTSPVSGSDARAQLALLALERNRQEVRAAFTSPSAAGHNVFPRSATFRWIAEHLAPRALVTTAASAALVRLPFGRLLGSLLFKRRVS
jgi:hypothetical protein